MADKSYHPAINALCGGQRQLDGDGVEVAVSRQALDETLAILQGLLDAAYFSSSVHRSQGLYDMSERMAVEKLEAAIAHAEGRAEPVEAA